MRRVTLAALLVAATFLFLGPSLTAQAPHAAVSGALTSTVSAAPARVKQGGTAMLSIRLINKSASIPGGVVDLEIYSASGAKIAQHAWEGQTLTKGKPSTYKWGWKPTARGTYRIKVGVFGAHWKPLQHWNDDALRLTVT